MPKITVHGGPSNEATGEGMPESDDNERSESISLPQGPTVDENFAANLKSLREEREMSQEALAERMQERGHPFHQATIYKIENKSRRVQLHEALDLANVLDTGIYMLVQSPKRFEFINRLFSNSQKFTESIRELKRAVDNYYQARLFVEMELEAYDPNDDENVRTAYQGIIEEIGEDVKRSATEHVEIIELRHHILDEGDNMPVPPEPEGEMTLAQQVTVAEWELTRATEMKHQVETRFEWAVEYLDTLRQKLDQKKSTPPDADGQAKE